MMFEVLTRILLWLLLGTIVWYAFIQFIPRVYLTWLGGLIVFTFVLLAFLDPADRTVSAVWSLFSLPLKPLGLSIFLLLMSIRDGIKKVKPNLVMAALFVLLLTSLPIVAYWLAGQTQTTVKEAKERQEILEPQPNMRAIVVLGDSTSPLDPSFRSRVQIGNSEDGFANALASRLLYVGKVYQEQAQAGIAPIVIVGAGPQISMQNSDGRKAAQQSITSFLVMAGVPQEAITVEVDGIDLRRNVLAIKEALEDRGFNTKTDSVLLVAPVLTISRAISSFARVDINVVPRPTDQFAFQLNHDRLIMAVSDLLPNVDALALTTQVVDEYLTAVYYFLRGWIANPLPY